MSDKIKVKVYVDFGYYEYEVGSVEQAVAHGHAIMRTGVYRRAIPGGMEFHPCYKVKLVGPGLESEYMDRFCRT
jgi:hypothetical protein